MILRHALVEPLVITSLQEFGQGSWAGHGSWVGGTGSGHADRESRLKSDKVFVLNTWRRKRSINGCLIEIWKMMKHVNETCKPITISNNVKREKSCISSSQSFWTKLLICFLYFCPKKVANLNFAPFLQVQHCFMFFRFGNTLPPLRNLSTLPPLASPHSSSEKFGTGSLHGGAGGWLGEVSRSIGFSKTPMAAEPEAAEVLMPKKWPLCLRSIPQKLSLCLLGKHALKMVEDITRKRSWRSSPASWMAWMRPV